MRAAPAAAKIFCVVLIDLQPPIPFKVRKRSFQSVAQTDYEVRLIIDYTHSRAVFKPSYSVRPSDTAEPRWAATVAVKTGF